MVELMINGPGGRLEARYHHSEVAGAPIALVLHPHPQHGGTMNNKVVYTIFQCFRERGFSVLRFNFRGVGRSQGRFDQGLGELSDAAAALDWLQTHNANSSRCWISGFSFGAWIAMQVLMRRPEIHGFVAVSPPANHFDFAFLAPCPSSGLVVQGNKDDIVPEANVAKLAQRLQSQRHIEIEYRVIKGANHFFEDKLDVLGGAVSGYLQKSVQIQAKKAAAAS
jgi:alpha/beta superfamily hydrolase